MTDETLRPPSSRLSVKPRPKKKKKPGAHPGQNLRFIPAPIREPNRDKIANQLVSGKGVSAAQTLDQAYRARRGLIEQRSAMVGPVQAQSAFMREVAERALRLTAEFCLPLGRELCLETHPVPFTDEEYRAFELAARRAGYRGKNLLRYVPENVSWADFGNLPFRINLPSVDSGIPCLPTLAPHGDELGVLNGCWYLLIPRLPFMSAGKTMAEQEAILPQIACLYRTRPTLITLGDAADLAFLLALAAWGGDLDGEPVSIARTMTNVTTGERAHSCVIFGPAEVGIIKLEDDFRAPYAGIAPLVV